MKKKSQAFAYFILWLLLIGTVFIVSGMEKAENKAEKSPAPSPKAGAEQKEESSNPIEPKPVSAEPEEDKELIGIWISYLSLSTKEGTKEAFEENFIKMVEEAKRVKANSLFVHVRPFSDSMYPSQYFPWSHLLTGEQGKDPGYDPLQFMIDTAHENGMEFHAWINPLRVKLATVPEKLSDENPYKQLSEEHPYYFLQQEDAIVLNPAYKEVRNLIADGVKEIVENYDVDGIHFDDYFYPENVGDGDSQAYDAYRDKTENPISVEEWRVANINSLISQVYRIIKEVKPQVVFGISPQGNISNNLSLGADVLAWVSTKGYIDYIMPQLYFSYDNPALGFTEALDSWLKLTKHDELKLYIGLGLYKAGTDSDENTWKGKPDIIAKQIEEIREKGAGGYVFFDIDSLFSEDAEDTVAKIEELLSADDSREGSATQG